METCVIKCNVNCIVTAEILLSTKIDITHKRYADKNLCVSSKSKSTYKQIPTLESLFGLLCIFIWRL